MKNFTSSFFNTKLLVALIFSLVNLHTLYSQNASNYVFSAEIKTYEPITGGTVIFDNLADDDEFFAGENIGFDFEYLGTKYSQLGISENGYVHFGGSTSTTSYPIINNFPNTLAGFSGNLTAQASSELRIETEGTTPNRVCVIQWENYTWYGQTDSYDFQIRLHETSNKITYHYGSFNYPGIQLVAQVGIIGVNNNDISLRDYVGPGNWNTSNTIYSDVSNRGIEITSDIKPTEGLSFSYSTPPADLNLSYAINTSNPCKGEIIEYTVEVTNNGPNDTYNAEVLSEIPAGLTFENATASDGTYNSTTGIWDIGDITNGNSASLLISASVNNDQGGLTINSSAAITNSFAEDPDPSNNSSNLSVTVSNNSLPEISTIGNQAVDYNQTSAPVNFTISDSDVGTSPDDLILSVTSSNTTVIPVSGIVFSGSGENRSFTITPGLNQFGTSEVTIEVSDGSCSSTSSFSVEVFKQSYGNFESAKFVVGQVDFNTTSTVASDVTAPGSNSSAVSAKGVLAVGSQTTNRVLIWNSVPTSNGTAANVVVGQSNFTNTGANNGTTGLNAPDGVNFSPDGNKLIVADAGNNRILIWNSIPTTNNEPADVVLGQNNFTDNDPGLAANRFNRPTDVQITSDGKMIVTDRNNSRVLIFNKIPNTNFVDADLVIGQPDFTTNTATASRNGLYIPWNTALSPDGKLLIADDENNRVLIYNNIPTEDGAFADVVIGQNNFTDWVPGSTADKMNSPGITVSPSGVLAIADYRNNRVLVYNEIPISNGAPADIVLGQPNFTQNVDFNDGNNSVGTPDDRNMSEPYGINYDLNERLFVNGRAMHRMMVFGETPTQVSDLALSFNADNLNPCVNSLVTFTVNLTNNGPDNATNISVISALPVGFTLQEATASTGTYNQSSGYWTIPYVGNGETVSLEMKGTVNVGENTNSITTYASLRSYNQADSDFSNNAGSITVNVADNEAPSITAIPDQITDINTTTPPITFTIDDFETPEGSLTVSAVSSNTSVIKNNKITIGGTDANRNLTINPENNQTGPVTITVTVDDGTCTTTESFEISVGNVWLGNTNDWNTASNWSTSLPSSTVGAIIPAAPLGGNYPVINADADVNNLGINAGARLTINATRTLDVYGDFYNDGSESTGSGILNIRGAAAQNIRGITGGLNINNASGVTLSGNLNVMEVLDLTAGTLTIGANTLTIRNPINGNNANLLTANTSSITVEGSTAGINLPAQVSQLNTLTLNNGSGLTLNANIILDNLILSSGSLRLEGNDMTINGSINSTAGLLSGNINSNLTINGAGAAGSLQISTTDNVFNNFEINRTAGELTIQNDLRIAGILSLTEGVISTNDRIWVENTDPNAISAFSTSSYINGQLRRCVTAGQSYNFPVGSPNHLENALISFTSISAATCIDAEFNPGLTGNGPTGLTIGSNEVTGVLDYGFWTIEPTNLSSVIEYDISLTSIGHTNGDAADNHVVLKRGTDADDWAIVGNYSSANAGGSFTDPITVSRSGLNSFSDFSVGVSTEGPLPINLLYFKGELKNNYTKLSWETSSEINNDYFEIQKSKDCENFEPIGTVEGNGTTNSKSNYAYSDYSVNSGKTYYRFKQLDYDGQFSYSPIVNIDYQNRNGQLVLAPNPAQNEVQILLENSNVLNCNVAIYDQMGKLMIQENFDLKDNPDVKLDISLLVTGVYQIRTVYKTATGSIMGYAKLVKQ
ncbi:T9SS type A sorting domain-containing protein [Marivirga salinae]|uniref:T9SS type A sorting domain-containing protein n=1 Tax=Marivirga salinarum TaxID=3059078 RepID=A0AA51NAG2_9BACT|nr:T9SS type A sorting domain-containing protein [Marivirga sp. BDSF4-3]WMN11424.1 T9SS type A sorting domain-containing protein [Marivirga sp. BDSF4-3]